MIPWLIWDVQVLVAMITRSVISWCTFNVAAIFFSGSSHIWRTTVHHDTTIRHDNISATETSDKSIALMLEHFSNSYTIVAGIYRRKPPRARERGRGFQTINR